MVGTLAAGRREPTAPAAGAACARVDSAGSTASADSMAVAGLVDSTAAGGASVRESLTFDDSGGRRNEHVALTWVEQDSRCSRGRVFGADRHACLVAFVPEQAGEHGGGYYG